jgi:hypothetical protein
LFSNFTGKRSELDDVSFQSLKSSVTQLFNHVAQQKQIDGQLEVEIKFHFQQLEQQINTNNEELYAHVAQQLQTDENLEQKINDNNLTKSPIGTITAWVPKVQQNQPSAIELPSGN